MDDIGSDEERVVNLAKQEDKQSAVLSYFREVSEKYYDNEDIRSKIEENIDYFGNHSMRLNFNISLCEEKSDQRN